MKFREAVPLKRRGSVAKVRTLSEAVLELQELTNAFMFAHQGSGPVIRDVAISRVLVANPGLHRELEALAAVDALHKARTLHPAVQRGRAADDAVTALSKALGGGDSRMGLKLVAQHFPKLHARWLGLPS